MSRWKITSLVLILGLVIGCIIPAATFWWANKYQTNFALNENNLDKDLYKEEVSSEPLANKRYHFGLDKGVLSVIEGKHGVSGNVIVTGLNVESWPNDILKMACEVEFYSLDEVQSFIDTAQESLHLE